MLVITYSFSGVTRMLDLSGVARILFFFEITRILGIFLWLIVYRKLKRVIKQWYFRLL